MKTNKLQSLKRFASKVSLRAKKNAPELFMVAGAIAVVASVVEACFATKKAEEIMKEHNENVELLQGDAGEDADLRPVYIHTCLKMAKTYALTVGTCVLGIGCFVGAHKEMRKRLTVASTSLLATVTAFDEYRKRVVEDGGREKDIQYRYGLTDISPAEDTDISSGDAVNSLSDTTYSAITSRETIEEDYRTKYFNADTSKVYISNNFDMNKYTIIGVQRTLQTELEAKGFIFLNDAYEQLGLDKTKEGYRLGWIYREDKVIDFKPVVMVSDDEMNPTFVLEFNIDGPIISLLDIPTA